MKRVNTADTTPGKAPGEGSGIGRVVIVEDQRLVAEVFSLHCRGLGLPAVAHCGPCQEGLAAIRKHEPDLVLMDISLPDGDGLEMAKTVLDELPRIKILAISSHRDP